MIVLDTHVWIWYVSNPKQLSVKAREAINQSMAKNTIFISSISAWEVAMLTKKGRLKLTMDVIDWINKTESLPFIKFIPVSNNIATKSVQLPGLINNDPADRIIIATALTLGAILVTKDENIWKNTNVKSIW